MNHLHSRWRLNTAYTRAMVRRVIAIGINSHDQIHLKKKSFCPMFILVSVLSRDFPSTYLTIEIWCTCIVWVMLKSFIWWRLEPLSDRACNFQNTFQCWNTLNDLILPTLKVEIKLCICMKKSVLLDIVLWSMVTFAFFLHKLQNCPEIIIS